MKKYRVNVNGTVYEIELEDITGVSVPEPAPAPVAAPVAAPAPAAPAAVTGKGEQVTAPMPGNILEVCVSVGQSVKVGDVLLVLEAMKMENEIFAPVDGTIQSIDVTKGDTVNAGAPMCTIG